MFKENKQSSSTAAPHAAAQQYVDVILTSLHSFVKHTSMTEVVQATSASDCRHQD